MKNKARIAAVSSLLALAALFLYIWHDPRLDDGALEFAETSPLEVFLIMSTVVAILAVWIYGIVQLAASRQWRLFWLAVLVWPASHAYVIFRKRDAR